MSDENFVSPPVGEPVPPVGPSDVGATELPLPEDDGVEYVDPLGAEVAAGARSAGAPKPPTGDQLISYARSLIGNTGHVRENVNKFTKAFYGDSTAASWCCIFVWYCLNHFGSASLINGKIAYVPNLKAHVGSKWHTSKDLIAKGDPVAYDFNHSGEPEHVGFFIQWISKSAGTFLAVEGNTGNDVVALRTRSWRDVYGFVKPGLSPENPDAFPGVVYKYAQNKPVQSSPHIKWAQGRLNALGAKPALKEDGEYGEKTESAVEAFQRSAGLTADGELGSKTWAKLAK